MASLFDDLQSEEDLLHEKIRELKASERALKQQSLMSENRDLRSQLEQKYSLDNIISQDYKMAGVFELIEAVADSNTTILMTGPSGTGKSLLARAIQHL